MESLQTRITAAQALWTRGQQAEQARDYPSAYASYTEAHDLIMDCARLHQAAHEHLRRVNLKLGNYGELFTDWALHFLAPLGLFQLISYLAKTEAFGSKICSKDGLGT